VTREPFSAESVARQLDDCTFCPKMCRHACPVSTASGRETHIPQVKMDRLSQLRLGRGSWTAEATDPLWACTGCRHCTMYCDHGNEPGLVLLTGRAAAVARGATHPALAGYPERFRARDERLSAQLATAFARGPLATAGDVGYWPGCDAIDKGAADIAAALALFDRLALAQVRLVAAPQACAGYPLLAAGHRDLFRWHAGRVATSLRGFRKVAVGCSACLYALRALYPAEGVGVRAEIVALADLLAPSASQLAGSPRSRTVYYHDPCYHARYNNSVEAPRHALSQLVELRELGWTRADTECCGGGGLLPKTMPLVADQMARRQLAEVQVSGGGLVVTSCATCAFMLQRNAPPAVEVMNLASALAQLSGPTVTAPAVPADDDA
jgi:Fe-S oxidoreductase